MRRYIGISLSATDDAVWVVAVILANAVGAIIGVLFGIGRASKIAAVRLTPEGVERPRGLVHVDIRKVGVIPDGCGCACTAAAPRQTV